MIAKNLNQIAEHRTSLMHWSALLPALLGIAYFIFCWLTLSRQYTFDAISYLWDVENTHLSIPLQPELITYNFFHSQHLLFSFSVYLFYHLWTFVGYHGSALIPAQILNLMEGSLTLSLFCRYLVTLTDDVQLSSFCCLVLGCSYAFWSNTAMVSDHMASCLFSLIFFGVLSKTSIATSSTRRIAFLGFINGVAVLMHQVNALLGIMFIVVLCFEKAGISSRMKSLVIYTTAAGLTVALPYLYIGIVVLENTTLYDFVFWCFYYAMPGVIDVAGHYGTFSVTKLGELFSGFGASFIGGFYWMNRIFESRALYRYGIPMLSACSVIVFSYLLYFVVTRRHKQKISVFHQNVRRLSIVWFSAYAMLLFWWWPTYYQLWAVPLIGLMMFFAASLHGKTYGSFPMTFKVGLTSFFLFLFTANLLAAFLPLHDIENNYYYTTTMTIGKNVDREDVILVIGNDEYETYIPYFIKREVISLHAVLIDHRNDLKASLSEIEKKIDSVRSKRHNVYIVSELYDSVRTYREVYELHHLTNKDIAPFFRQYTVEDTLKTEDLKLYKIKGKHR